MITYNGFSFEYDSKNKSSYYEQLKTTIISQPLNPSDMEIFSFSLETWRDYCKNNQTLRREQFNKIGYFNIDQIKKNALAIHSIESRNSVDLIISPFKVNQMEVDAVVNAANETLLGGGGVDEDIHRLAGFLLIRECAHLDGCQVGEAKITKGYHLLAPYVIHTVGPVLLSNDEPDKEALAQCYRDCLKICEKNKLESIAFPCISCGFYGFPKDISAQIAINEVSNHLKKSKSYLKTIIFSVINSDAQTIYIKELNKNLKN